MIENSPAADLKLPAKEVSRDRILEDDEIAAVWRAAQEIGHPYGSIVRLLILSRQRRDEVVSLQWEDFDKDLTLWTIPKERTKAGRAHEVPLSSQFRTVLAELSPEREGLLFAARSTRKTSQGPRTFSGFSKAKLELDQLSGVTDWRLQDLRRTAVSGMARLGHPPHVVAAILNHSPGGTQGITAVYNRYRYVDEKRAAHGGMGAVCRGVDQRWRAACTRRNSPFLDRHSVSIGTVELISIKDSYHFEGACVMSGNQATTETVKAKLFMHGRSQAVRTPKDFRFEGKEVLVSKVGSKVVLEPVEAPPFDVEAWRRWLDELGARDFLPEGLEDDPPIGPDPELDDI